VTLKKNIAPQLHVRNSEIAIFFQQCTTSSFLKKILLLSCMPEILELQFFSAVHNVKLFKKHLALQLHICTWLRKCRQRKAEELQLWNFIIALLDFRNSQKDPNPKRSEIVCFTLSWIQKLCADLAPAPK
jgi:hypothetical protein